jgi:hypothetical protein
MLHFMERLRGALAGFFNLSRPQILGFGRHLPGDRFSVGLAGLNVRVDVSLHRAAGSRWSE